MKFRVARHTIDLKRIIHFYKNLLGLNVLGEFKNHAGYDGVFLGFQNVNWHLEFTVSKDLPQHKPDEDDLLVFYLKSIEEYESLKAIFRNNNISEVEPKNPYWQANGTLYLDPDGYGVILTISK
ncbi:VOC family protein [Mucilaginibacter jinjuensis]|uniref:VOC family protein n=1 Tax=Mucilaginibacter jinjuensis TaxID=1176721 RepID=A0ABY7T189_9SPHI|nr:VOC family protein [Mucilaginibacter jinjuensis]WCT10200.1 VOC family protein [Mucilaginibacter jinjuensis]